MCAKTSARPIQETYIPFIILLSHIPSYIFLHPTLIFLYSTSYILIFHFLYSSYIPITFLYSYIPRLFSYILPFPLLYSYIPLLYSYILLANFIFPFLYSTYIPTMFLYSSPVFYFYFLS